MTTNAPRMDTTSPRRPGSRRPAPRDVAAVLIGLEAGLLVGLFAFGTTLLAPLGVGILGAAAGYGIRRSRQRVFRWALRSQLRAAR